MISQLLAEAIGIETASLDGENTAVRVGGFLRRLVLEGKFDYDPAFPYVAGQVMFEPVAGKFYQCTLPTTAGQSPTTHPAKWNDWSVTVAEEVTPNGPDKKVGSKLLATYVSNAVSNVDPGTGTVPNATDTVAGKVVRATDTTLVDEEDPRHATDYLSPKQVLALLASLKESQTIEQTLLNGNTAETIIQANGGIAAVAWPNATGTKDKVFVPEYKAGEGWTIAVTTVADLLGTQYPPLTANLLPTLDGTEGEAFEATFSDKLATAADNPTVTYEAYGDQPAGVIIDGPGRKIYSPKLTASGPVTLQILAKAANRESIVIPIPFPIRPKGQNLYIQGVYLETNQGGSLSAYVFASAGTGIVRATLTGRNATSYSAVARDGQTNNGEGFPSYSGLFTGKAPYGMLWGQVVNGADNRPTIPGDYKLRVEVLTPAGAAVSPALFVEIDFTIGSSGISARLYPASGENLPPVYNNTFPATRSINQGETWEGNANDYIDDPENDTLSFYYDVPVTGAANVSINTTTGAFTVSAQAGTFSLYALDSQNRRAGTGPCTVSVVSAAFAIQRVDFNAVFTPPVGAPSENSHAFRLLLANVPSGATLRLEKDYWYYNQGSQNAPVGTVLGTLSADSSSWFTHVTASGIQASFGNQTEQILWAVYLKVNNTRYPILTGAGAMQGTYPNWTTVIGATTPGDDLINRTFTGAVTQGYSTDTNWLNLTATLGSDGKVRISNSVSVSVPGDRLLYYDVNGQLMTTLANWTSLPGEPIKVVMFFFRKASDGSPLDPPWQRRQFSSLHVEASLIVY